MWLRAELFADHSDTVIAAIDVADVDRDEIPQACRRAASGLDAQLRQRDLELQLVRLIPELVAELFPGQEVPARKVEGWFSWTGMATARPSVLLVLRGEFAGQWKCMLTGDDGGPLELIARRAPEVAEGPAPVGFDAAAWAAAFLVRHAPAQAQAALPGGEAADAA